jgi:uncharacterized protein
VLYSKVYRPDVVIHSAAMQYLIDGHNLIGRLPDLSLDDPNDEAQLVQKLAGFSARTKSKCTVIFDKGLPAGQSRMSTGSVKVVFAPRHSSADQVMIQRINKVSNPQMWTVVSSDNEVLNAAIRRKMKTLKSADFAALMQRPPPPDRPGRDIDADLRLSADEVDEWLRLFRKK